MSVLCSAVLADEATFLSMDLATCSSRLAARAEQAPAEVDEAAKSGMSAHQGELERLAAFLNTPNEGCADNLDSGSVYLKEVLSSLPHCLLGLFTSGRSVLAAPCCHNEPEADASCWNNRASSQRHGVKNRRLRRKPGRPRKTLRLVSPGGDAPETSGLQAPGREPAPLHLSTAIPPKRRPGRPRKKPLAKFADPTALSAGEEAALPGSTTVTVELERAGSGGVTSALNAVAELCHDVNPGSSGSPAARETPRQAASRSRLRLMSGMPPEAAPRLPPEAAPQLPQLTHGGPQAGAEEIIGDVAGRGAAQAENDMVAGPRLAAFTIDFEAVVEPTTVEADAEAALQQQGPPALDTQLLSAAQPAEQQAEEGIAGGRAQLPSGAAQPFAAPPKLPAAPSEQQGLEVPGKGGRSLAAQHASHAGQASALKPAEQSPKRKRGRPPKTKQLPLSVAAYQSPDAPQRPAGRAPPSAPADIASAPDRDRETGVQTAHAKGKTAEQQDEMPEQSPPVAAPQEAPTDVDSGTAPGSAAAAQPAERNGERREQGRAAGKHAKEIDKNSIATPVPDAAPQQARKDATAAAAAADSQDRQPAARHAKEAGEPSQKPSKATPAKRKRAADAAAAPTDFANQRRVSWQQPSSGAAAGGKGSVKAGRKGAGVGKQRAAPEAASVGTEAISDVTACNNGVVKTAANDWR